MKNKKGTVKKITKRGQSKKSLNEKANLETRTCAPVNRLLSFLNSSIIIHHFKGTDTPPLRIKSLFKTRTAEKKYI